MADMTRFDLDKVNVIGKLGTTVQERGLTTQQFKDKFDEGPIALGEFVNETLIPEVEAHLADNAAHGVSHKNLLHNWDFRNPVNQRGQSSYGTSQSYTIDRWYMGNEMTVSVGNGHITLNNTGSVIRELQQKIDNISLLLNKTVTLSVMLPDGQILSKSDVVSMPMDRIDGRVYIYDNDGVTLFGFVQLYSANADTPPYIRICTYGGQTLNLSAIKLELGSASTLANDPPADYGEQLALCQRYCVVYRGASGYIGIGNAFSATNVYILINLPCSMRALPSISYSGSPILRTGATDLAITGLSTWGGVNGNCITLKADVSGATVGEKYMFFVSSSDKIILSADL